MENASKALIIAGAVLISIVLISLGVILIGNSGDSSDQAKETANMIENKSDQAIEKLNTSLNFLN